MNYFVCILVSTEKTTTSRWYQWQCNNIIWYQCVLPGEFWCWCNFKYSTNVPVSYDTTYICFYYFTGNACMIDDSCSVNFFLAEHYVNKSGNSDKIRTRNWKIAFLFSSFKCAFYNFEGVLIGIFSLVKKSLLKTFGLFKFNWKV